MCPQTDRDASTMPENSSKTPQALLLLAPGCAHCPAILTGLTGLIKSGKLSRLEVIDITQSPELAEAYGVRSVPWTRIGAFELVGAQTPEELEHWVRAASGGGGVAEYYSHLLESQRLEQALSHIRQHPASLLDLVLLLSSLETPMAVRIGIGAVIEELAGSGLLDRIVPELEQLTRSDEPQTRADACHYLSIAGNPSALETIRVLQDDPDPEVREIAAESLAVLSADTLGTTD